MDIRKEHFQRAMDYESQLISVWGLVQALQIVCWDFTQAELKDPHLNRIRSSIVGLGDALEALLASDFDPATEASD